MYPKRSRPLLGWPGQARQAPEKPGRGSRGGPRGAQSQDSSHVAVRRQVPGRSGVSTPGLLACGWGLRWTFWAQAGAPGAETSKELDITLLAEAPEA